MIKGATENQLLLQLRQSLVTIKKITRLKSTVRIPFWLNERINPSASTWDAEHNIRGSTLTNLEKTELLDATTLLAAKARSTTINSRLSNKSFHKKLIPKKKVMGYTRGVRSMLAKLKSHGLVRPPVLKTFSTSWFPKLDTTYTDCISSFVIFSSLPYRRVIYNSKQPAQLARNAAFNIQLAACIRQPQTVKGHSSRATYASDPYGLRHSIMSIAGDIMTPYFRRMLCHWITFSCNSMISFGLAGNIAAMMPKP